MSRSHAVRRFRLAGLCAALLLVAFSLASVADAQLSETGEVSTLVEVEVTAPPTRSDHAGWVVAEQPDDDPTVADDATPSRPSALDRGSATPVAASPGAPPPLRGPPNHAAS